MKASYFNHGWLVKEGITDPFDAIFQQGKPAGKPVMLPQDAMILEERDSRCRSKCQSGFYPAKSYTYTRTFTAPAEWEGKTSILEFEGIMEKATVSLNGEVLARHSYGYTSTFADLTDALIYGKTNTLQVVAVNNELSSRWYQGGGIYRDVILHQGGRIYIPVDGIRVTTESVDGDCAVLGIDYSVVNTGKRPERVNVCISIQEADGRVAKETSCGIFAAPSGAQTSRTRLILERAKLWDDEHPYLYSIRIRLSQEDELLDEACDTFGIRTLQLDARRGLRVNGRTVKLRGACIHQDHGIIGTTELMAAEEFKLGKLKEAGFNAVRIAHHPAAKLTLIACDRLGIYVMDELSDMWNEKKNINDFSECFASDMEDEISRMVAKDYNHPSVIMYSTGNEIPEIGRASGAVTNRKIVSAYKQQDKTRFLTCAISGFLAVVDHMGEYAASMEEQKKTAVQKADVPAEGAGSEEMNAVMGSAEQQMLDAFAVSPVLDKCLEPVEAELDVVGYNYLTKRHTYIHRKNPDAVVIGSETYPTEIARLWKIAEENDHVIGDFTWTGFDYLGEAGIGVFHYDAQQSGQGWYPDRLAYVGDIDINGTRRDISYLRECAFGLRKKPYITVERADKVGKTFDKNSWKYKNYIHSWNFPGFEGTEVNVDVISGCREIELFVDGKSAGRKKNGTAEPFVTTFRLAYHGGTLKAVGYDEDGQVIGTDTLSSQTGRNQLSVKTSKKVMKAGGRDLIYLTIDAADASGIRNYAVHSRVRVEVGGAGKLAGLGSADPSCEGNYFDQTAAMFDGRILAAVRSTDETGEIRVKISCEDMEEKRILLRAEE
ncbi:MAG: glycoside hydrolase family 2 TIM barrel-domain containing protein [Bilifractor sp.]